MKTWILSSNIVQGMDSWVCYCEQNPAELIRTEPYEELLSSTLDDLYYSYGYLYDEEPDDEEWESWSEDERYDFEQEQYNNFCEQVSFSAYETEEPEDFDILIDERENN